LAPDEPLQPLPSDAPSGSGPRARQLIVERDAGQRIDNFLARELRGIPKTRIYRMLRTGEVRVNGGRVKPAHRLAIGDRVRVPPIQGLREGEVGAAAAHIGADLLQRLERSILFEDAGLIALDKPAGLAVHGGSGLSFGAIEALRRLRPHDDLQLAHRLDRDTSGCLLVAKSRSLLLELHRALREREVRKRYDVLVFGRWPRRTTSVQLPLQKFVLASGERRVRVAADGKPARTDFAIRTAVERATWLEARLHTGRTHQIRVHAQASGHPVVGDEKYATAGQQSLAADLGIHRLCLHASELVFVHQGARLRVSAPVPAEFEAAWRALERS
jgi:23S rRNA pseudouridine955/2504/2580 synthase